MDEHVKDFFKPYAEDERKGSFYKVISLHEADDVRWKPISRMAPTLPKGWFELCQLPAKTRIQFTFDYWISKIPYQPYLDSSLSSFFHSLDDIGVFLTQKRYDDLFEAQMVYSVSKNRGYYRGKVSAQETDILAMQQLFPDYILPHDYVSFLKIHNGFYKSTDCTGIISTAEMEAHYKTFKSFLQSEEEIKTESGRVVNPRSLIPFYESFGMPFYQCFWGEWHPEQEMGNVYFNAIEKRISDSTAKGGGSAEQLAFAKFTDWLIFYLEQIET